MSSNTNQPGNDDGVAKRAGDQPYPVKPWWVKKLKDWMELHDESALGLGKRVGANDVTIQNILKEKTKQSGYIPAICRATNLPLPTEEASWRRVDRPPDLQQAIEDFEELAQLDPEYAKEFAALLAATLKRKK